jgi:hypothetical protein
MFSPQIKKAIVTLETIESSFKIFFFFAVLEFEPRA